MNTFFPATGSETEWNLAYYRVEDYLRALRVENKFYQSQLILGILEKAAQRHAEDPSQSPTVLAMDQARAEVNLWFDNVLGHRERLTPTGLISFLAIDGPKRWPVLFLSDAVPPDFNHEMRDSGVRAGPDLEVSSMVPRPIDVSPLLDPLHITDALEKARWGPALVATAVALAALSVSYFLITR
jgi:hypothetical protein